MSKRDVPSPNENMAPPAGDDEGDNDRPAAKKARLDERVAVAGRVASVKLVNFMCHANLLIEFKTGANNCFYIGGPNGSGKSALFAAINLGLGGRGSDNDRGNTVKSYIKDGTNQAKITITLTNEGLNAHPEYDELISVERTINQTSSTYVMKSIHLNASGNQQSERIISKKKSDVDRIINRFNIHLSNPAFWMSQDRSRSFLANFKPSNVYKLYLESTNLDKILSSYQRFASSSQNCRETVRAKADEVKQESEQLKRMQEQKERNERIRADREMTMIYTWKLLFCAVRDREDEIALNQRKWDLNKELFGETKETYMKNRSDKTTIEKKGEALGEEVEALKMEMDENHKKLDEINEKYSEFDKKSKDFKQEIRVKHMQIQAANDEIKKAQREVRSIMEKQGSEELTKKLKMIEEKHAEVSAEREKMETGDEMNNRKDRLDLLLENKRVKENEKYQMDSQISQLRRTIEKKNESLRTAKAMKSDAINKFGARMADILREINRSKSDFDQIPKGPLGKYITLKDEKWTVAVEQCLGNYANQFICHSSRDASALRKIFDRLRLGNNDRPTIIVSKFLGRAHSGLHEPNGNYKTIYRYLDITDNDVHNALIDKCNCESILLIEDKMEAMNIMRQDPPRNSTKAYTVDGSEVYAGAPHGQYRFYASRNARAIGLFGGSHHEVNEAEVQHEITAAKEEIKRLESSGMKDMSSDLYNLNKEITDTKRWIGDFERRLSTLRSEEIKADRAIKDLRRQVADSANEEMLENLNDGIDETKKRIPELEQQIKDLEQKVEDVKIEAKPILDERAEIEREIEEGKKENKEFTAKLLEMQKQLSVLDEKGDFLRAQLAKLKADGEALFQNESKLKTERDNDLVAIAEKKLTVVRPEGEQDPPDLSDFPPTEVATKKLHDLSKAVDRAAAGADFTITIDSIKDFKDQLKRRRFYCRKIEEVLDHLQEVQNARLNSYPALKKFTEMKVCDKFQELLAVRGHFIGGLEFDHEKQTLNVNVQSCKDKDAMSSSQHGGDDEDDEEEDSESDYSDDDGGPRRKKAKKQPKKKKKRRDLKGLSGGERSFVTASLVMALWEVMEQPFRMMDEFDVFMDMMNRKLVMDLLVQLATKKFPHNQFIFFTPQGIKELKMVDGLQVFEMNKVRD